MRPMLIATKVRPPAIRDQVIPRERLLERLRAGSGLTLTLVICPAGFGKTTLLAAWYQAESARKPVAWLTLDEGDNDPVVLWSYVIEALRQVCPAVSLPPAPHPAAPHRAAPHRAEAAAFTDVVLPRLVSELHDQGDIVLVLDDFHRLSGAALDSMATFIGHAPSSLQLVLSTRAEPVLPLASLRAHGELIELRPGDLRFTPGETDEFLNGCLGLGLGRQDVEALLNRTEGWPAGLYLAALSMRREPADRHDFVTRFGASPNRHVTEFLKAEVLEAHDPAMQALMLRSSVLGRLSGPLCDVVLEQQHSAEMLDKLSRTNLFLVPFGDMGGWYRFHPLFAQLLRTELGRREPGVVPALHRRAYSWHRDHGTTEEAIHHAIEAGEYAAAAALIEATWVKYPGRTVLAWLGRFPAEILGRDVRLLLVQAWVLSRAARREEAARAIAAAERLGETGTGPLPDGFSSVEASLTTLRAVFPWGDAGVQLEYGSLATKLEGPGSSWRPVASWAVGMGLYLHGEFDAADRWFAESAMLAPASDRWLTAGSSLACRSLIAAELGRRDDQRLLAETAVALLGEHGIEETWGVEWLALGMSLAARGQPEEALPAVERATALLRSAGQPTGLAMGLLRQVPVLRALGQREYAEATIAEAGSVLASCPDPGILAGQLTAAKRSPRLGVRPGQDLTERERTVLKLLKAGLREREIGRELYVSRNTVHTHIQAIYRKLEVSTRADALERTRELGLSIE
jgi:LuxR family transcriptional regulator, maltose regulon positive regulatory protein